jgi:hypothetical protein
MPEADTRPAAVRTVADRRDGTRMSIVDMRNDTRSYANALARPVRDGSAEWDDDQTY